MVNLCTSNRRFTTERLSVSVWSTRLHKTIAARIASHTQHFCSAPDRSLLKYIMTWPDLRVLADVTGAFSPCRHHIHNDSAEEIGPSSARRLDASCAGDCKCSGSTLLDIFTTPMHHKSWSLHVSRFQLQSLYYGLLWCYHVLACARKSRQLLCQGPSITTGSEV